MKFSFFTKNSHLKILIKISEMLKIKSTNYRHDIYNLQTRLSSFPHQEKLLRQVDSG